MAGTAKIIIEIKVIDTDGVMAILDRIDRMEDRIMTQVGDFREELDPALQGLHDQIVDVDADLARELVDFANKVAPKLDQNELDQLGALAQKLTDFKTNIDAVDQPAPTA